MDLSKIEEIAKMIGELREKQPNGFVLIPTHDGFDVYEKPKRSLQILIKMDLEKMESLIDPQMKFSQLNAQIIKNKKQ